MHGISFNKAAIVTNLQRDPDLSKTRIAAGLLSKHGITPILPEMTDAYDDIIAGDISYNEADFIITLGGDGTILAAAEIVATRKLPIMGINIGNLGYLTDCSFEEAEEAIIKLKSGSYGMQKRMMLKAEGISKSGTSVRKYCLNDICVMRGATSKIIQFDLFINGNLANNYSADGIIISTPTGSTAYNLSAGGPILMPDAQMIAITPICPHTLSSRPIVVSSADKISIKISMSKKETMLMLDGQKPISLNDGDEVFIEKAPVYTEIIKTNKLDFYEILRKKLV